MTNTSSVIFFGAALIQMISSAAVPEAGSRLTYLTKPHSTKTDTITPPYAASLVMGPFPSMERLFAAPTDIAQFPDMERPFASTRLMTTQTRFHGLTPVERSAFSSSLAEEAPKRPHYNTNGGHSGSLPMLMSGSDDGTPTMPSVPSYEPAGLFASIGSPFETVRQHIDSLFSRLTDTLLGSFSTAPPTTPETSGYPMSEFEDITNTEIPMDSPENKGYLVHYSDSGRKWRTKNEEIINKVLSGDDSLIAHGYTQYISLDGKIIFYRTHVVIVNGDVVKDPANLFKDAESVSSGEGYESVPTRTNESGHSKTKIEPEADHSKTGIKPEVEFPETEIKPEVEFPETEIKPEVGYPETEMKSKMPSPNVMTRASSLPSSYGITLPTNDVSSDYKGDSLGTLNTIGNNAGSNANKINSPMPKRNEKETAGNSSRNFMAEPNKRVSEPISDIASSKNSPSNVKNIHMPDALKNEPKYIADQVTPKSLPAGNIRNSSEDYEYVDESI